MHSSLRSLLSFVGVALALGGCMSNGSTPTPVSGALTSGRVTSEGGASSGVTVHAYGVAADGSLVSASNAVTTSADGRYSLHVTLADGASQLVVRVEDGSDRMTSLGRAAVSSDLASSGTITLAPIDARSTFVSNVAISVEASEEVSPEESSATALFLSLDTTARLAASTDHAAAVSAGADALSSARATFVEGLDASASGSGSMQVALRGIADEEAQLALALDGATTEASMHTAYESYLDGVIAATASAGYSNESIAAASISASSALDASLGDRASAGRAELHELATFAVTDAVDAGIASSLSSTTITSASASLRTNMATMASSGASAEAVAAAWASYQTTISAEVVSHEGLEAALLTTLTADLDAAKAALRSSWAAMGPSASATARVQAFLDYRSSVESSAHASLLTTAGLDDTRAHAVLDAMADVGASAMAH